MNWISGFFPEHLRKKMRSRIPDTDRERALPPSGKTDEDKPADADGQRGEMKRTETLLQETDARQHERNYAGTDKHGETHSAKSGVLESDRR